MDRIGAAVEHVDRRVERIERAVDHQGNRLTALEARAGVTTSSASARP